MYASGVTDGSEQEVRRGEEETCEQYLIRDETST